MQTLIVGGGIAGLSLDKALEQRGMAADQGSPMRALGSNRVG
jgi:cation diffusion facilitator CzcD-associated flavoprotein CzcO